MSTHPNASPIDIIGVPSAELMSPGMDGSAGTHRMGNANGDQVDNTAGVNTAKTPTGSGQMAAGQQRVGQMTPLGPSSRQVY